MNDEILRDIIQTAATQTESVEQRAIRLLHERGHMANLTCDGQRDVESRVRQLIQGEFPHARK